MLYGDIYVTVSYVPFDSAQMSANSNFIASVVMSLVSSYFKFFTAITGVIENLKIMWRDYIAVLA